jgi:hypothetical protein
MKFITTQYENNKQDIFIFPKHIKYEVMADILPYIKNQTHGNWRRIPRQPISAGLVDHTQTCHTRDNLLYLGCRPEDTILLVNQPTMKYITTQDESGKHELFIFPQIINHDAMAEMLPDIDHENNEYRRSISAGFVDHNWKCYGRSESLDLDSRPEDTELLFKQLLTVENNIC